MDGKYLELSEEDFDLLDEVPLCGCGLPEGVLRLYHDQLKVTARAYPDSPDWPDYRDRVDAADGIEKLFHVVAYVLDAIEATEHGGNVSGAWLTDKGKRLLAILDRYAEVGFDATPCVPVTPST